MSRTPFSIVPDDVPLAHRLELPVLGHPVRFATNEARVLGVVREAFGAWAALDVALVTEAMAEVRIAIHEGTAPPATPRYELLDADHLVLHLSDVRPEPAHAQGSESSFGAADRTLLCAAVSLSRTHLDEPETFRYAVIEALVRFLLTGPRRLPLHGAALVRDGRAIVLGAHSGTGKSSLAWAALHDGWSLLAEDIVYVEPPPASRLWGGDAVLHVPVTSARFFPELVGRRADVRLGDATKLALRSPIAPALCARDMVLCAVDRGPALSLRRADRAAVIDRLVAREPGFDMYADDLRRALNAWSDAPTWLLTLGNDPRDALPLLREMLAR